HAWQKQWRPNRPLRSQNSPLRRVCRPPNRIPTGVTSAGTFVCVCLASVIRRTHTQVMRNSAIPRVLCLACVAAISLGAATAFADEIRLKDGKKLYGVIVAYEDNMFKVKTDYGYVLVEKDKIKEI